MALEPKETLPDFTKRGKDSPLAEKTQGATGKKGTGVIPYPNLAITLAQKLRERDRKKG